MFRQTIRKQEVIFTPQRQRSLLDAQEDNIRRLFIEAVALAKTNFTITRLVELIERGNLRQFVDEATAIVNSNVSSGITSAFVAAGTDLTAFIASNLRTIINFDQTNERAVNRLRTNHFLFQTLNGIQTDAVVRETLSAGLSEGINPVRTARDIRDSLGLNTRYSRAVRNFRRFLTAGANGEPRGEVLTRDLRDRRFDGTIRRAIMTGMPLTQMQIDRMVERYSARMLVYRSNVVARTETLRALNQGYEESVQQQIDSGVVRENEVLREWDASNDSRVRDSHRFLNGMRRRVGEDFIRGQLRFPGDPRGPANEVIQCRCVLTLVFEDLEPNNQ